MTTLYELTGKALELQKLASQGDIDEQAFKDTLEGLESEIEQKVGACAAVISNLKYDKGLLDAKSALMRAEVDRLNTRKDAIAYNIQRLKDSMLASMQALSLKTCKTLTHTVSCVTRESVNIDYSALDKRFLKYKPQQIDATATKQEVQNFADNIEGLAGVEQVKKTHITIR